jgi:hypothetical protein
MHSVRKDRIHFDHYSIPVTYAYHIDAEHWVSPPELKGGLALVAHACNPSYSEGRDQEDCSPKPGLGK